MTTVTITKTFTPIYWMEFQKDERMVELLDLEVVVREPDYKLVKYTFLWKQTDEEIKQSWFTRFPASPSPAHSQTAPSVRGSSSRHRNAGSWWRMRGWRGS